MSYDKSTSPGKRTRAAELPVKRSPSTADLQSAATFASGDAVDAVVQLTAKRLDDAAEQIDRIGDAVQKGGDGGRRREDYREMAQAVIDRAGARGKGDIEDILALLNRTGAMLGSIGVNQLNGARMRIYNAAAGARLSLNVAPILALAEPNRMLHERLGIKADPAGAEVAPANKKDEQALLEAAILANLDAATREARFVRASLPARLVATLRRPVKATWAHLQEAYVLIRELAHASDYAKPVKAATGEVQGLLDDVKVQPELAGWPETRNLHAILHTPWRS